MVYNSDHPERIILPPKPGANAHSPIIIEHSILGEDKLFLRVQKGAPASSFNIGHMPRESVVDLVAVLAYWLNHGTLEVGNERLE